MQYRTVKKTGEKISTLGFGCMRFQTKLGKIDVQKAKEQIILAIENGVNYLDTAWIYHLGESESFLGEHILKDYRDKVNIATKLPCYLINKTSQFNEIFEKQRKKLQVECIDYYLLHALDLSNYKKMLKLGIIDFMNELKASGKVRNIGFSFHSSYEDFIEICDSYDWDFCQVQYNIIDENFQAGIKGIRYASDKGLGVFVMEPLRGGSLVGDLPEKVKNIYATAKVQREPADWALRWIYDNEDVTMVLSGMNQISQVEQNVKTACEAVPNCLSDDEREIIKSVRNVFDELLVVKCTGCRYCMPCPAKINIPDAFKSLNDQKMYGFRAKKRYMLTVGGRKVDGKVRWTTACLNCGKCEEHCPQHLPVRENLKLVHKKLEGIDAKIVGAVSRIFTN